MLSASYNVQSLVRRAFGQVPGGMFGADENARIGFLIPDKVLKPAASWNRWLLMKLCFRSVVILTGLKTVRM